MLFATFVINLIVPVL